MKKEIIIIAVLFFALGWTSCGYIIYRGMMSQAVAFMPEVRK